jgi:tRNA-2-methylthio-N6-dimethylallyladenosine synthase
MNVRDTEAVEELLESCGHERVEAEDAADLVIVNTCSVRGKAEDKALGKLGLLCATKRDRPGRIVGVMGCMAQRLNEELFRRIPALDFAVGTRAAARVPGVVDRVVAGEGPVCELGNDPADGHADGGRDDVVVAHHPGQRLAFVTILLGCERRCAYCIVPDVRGQEYSRPARDIVAEVRAVVAEGARDVTLLGQSVMNYGKRSPVWSEDETSPMAFAEPLPRLFEAIHRDVPGLRRLRFTSGHPSGVTPELARAMRVLPLLCPHLHLPVQSGSDRVLARMRRGYTRADYLEAIRRLREAVPDLALTTDVIVGFPGETEADFEETRSLMEAAAFDNAFIFKYSPRPGTPAAAWADDVRAVEKARRNQLLLADQDARGLALNERWRGRVVEVLAEGPSLRNKKRWSGRSPQNKIVVFEPSRPVTEGQFVHVRVTGAQAQTLYGELAE